MRSTLVSCMVTERIGDTTLMESPSGTPIESAASHNNTHVPDGSNSCWIDSYVTRGTWIPSHVVRSLATNLRSDGNLARPSARMHSNTCSPCSGPPGKRAGSIAMTSSPFAVGAPPGCPPSGGCGVSTLKVPPVRPAAKSSTINAILLPFAPPNVHWAPSKPFAGSVVGFPSTSTALPEGTLRPSIIARVMSPRAITLDAWSQTSGGVVPERGHANAIGFVPKTRRALPCGATNANELTNTSATRPCFAISSASHHNAEKCSAPLTDSTATPCSRVLSIRRGSAADNATGA
mmetsp:Transcript_38325/g.105570  ORF Transcript_38325/g.105570 Transcript_38325/m.105570 type:complete len:291 (+) Transcript_38325:33-905(+)